MLQSQILPQDELASLSSHPATKQFVHHSPSEKHELIQLVMTRSRLSVLVSLHASFHDTKQASFRPDFVAASPAPTPMNAPSSPSLVDMRPTTNCREETVPDRPLTTIRPNVPKNDFFLCVSRSHRFVSFYLTCRHEHVSQNSEHHLRMVAQLP